MAFLLWNVRVRRNVPRTNTAVSGFHSERAPRAQPPRSGSLRWPIARGARRRPRRLARTLAAGVGPRFGNAPARAAPASRATATSRTVFRRRQSERRRPRPVNQSLLEVPVRRREQTFVRSDNLAPYRLIARAIDRDQKTRPLPFLCRGGRSADNLANEEHLIDMKGVWRYMRVLRPIINCGNLYWIDV